MKRLRLLALVAVLPLAACVTTRPPPAQPAQAPRTQTAAAQPSPAPATTRPAAGGKRRPVVRITEPDIKDGPPDPAHVPADIDAIPDAVPRHEPRTASGNPPEYEAFGELYKVLESSRGFREVGRASWYGKKFHGKATASGEPYDMFAMTAAHKTLPIPSYVRVTNLDNGRKAIIRINDRGPFHNGRIIDLSYAAAARLDVIGHGSVNVEVVAVQPADDAPVYAIAPTAPASAFGGRYLQVAAYSNPASARAMRESLEKQGMRDVDVRTARGGALHRVVIGPFSNENDVARTRARLNNAGYAAFQLKE